MTKGGLNVNKCILSSDFQNKRKQDLGSAYFSVISDA